MRTRRVVSGVLLVVVATACGNASVADDPGTSTTLLPAPVTTTTMAPGAPTTGVTGDVQVPANSPSSLPAVIFPDPEVKAGGPAPWAASPLAQDQVPPVLVEGWNRASNRSWCAALAPADPAALGFGATVRQPNFSGDWALAWDLPSGPGMTGGSQPCTDCGRSAFGIAGISLRATGQEPYRWPSVIEFDDGSAAGWGNEGNASDEAFVDPATGERVTPRKLSYMTVVGQDCFYNVWSNLGEEHLLQFIDQLRFVEGLRTEPITSCSEGIPTPPGAGEVLIFAVCEDTGPLPYPLVRTPPGRDPVHWAVSSLVRGTTETEQAAGLWVGFDWLDPGVAQRIRVTTDLGDDGILHLGFSLDGEPWDPGSLAGTSAQTISFIDPLYATVFQFPEVTGLDESTLCWGELACDGVMTRTLWETMATTSRGPDVGPGCGVIGAWWDPDCGAETLECGETIELTFEVEGATGSAVYSLGTTAPADCFVSLEGTVTVLSADRAAAAVDGSPISFRHRGLVSPKGFAPLDKSRPRIRQVHR